MKVEENNNVKDLVPVKKFKGKLIILFIILILIVLVSAIFAYKLKKEEIKEKILYDLNIMGIENEREIGKDQMEIDYINNLTYSITYPEIGIEKIDMQIKNIITSIKNDFILTYAYTKGNKEKYFDYVVYETYLAPENKFSLVLTENQMLNETNVLFEKSYIYIFDLETGELLNYSDIFKDGYKNEITNMLSFIFETEEYKNKVYEDYYNIITNTNYKIAITNDGLIIYFDKYEIMSGDFGIVKINIDYDDIKDYLKINKEDKLIPQKVSGDMNISGDASISGDANASGENMQNENLRYAITAVNVRKEKTVNSRKLGTLQEGESINIISDENGWSKVIYKGEEGYINSDYLSEVKIEHKVVELTIKDRNIDTSKPMVAITFDDGPNPNSTPRILETLEKYNVVATFFDLGQLVNTYPDIVRKEEEIGCEVGNHTYSHANLNILSEEDLKAEIKKSETAFENALGHKTTLFRPAYGNANSKVKQIVEYPLITWNVDSLDWKTRNKDKILNRIYQTKNFDGKIILMHSIYESTADATEELIPELLNRGYELVTVSELAYYKGKTLETGKVYTNF